MMDFIRLKKTTEQAASRAGACKDGRIALAGTVDKEGMISLYLDNLDFCLHAGFPDNEFIRENFKGVLEPKGIYLDSLIDVSNLRRIVCLGGTMGTVRVSGYSVSEIYLKDDPELLLEASDHSFVVADVHGGALTVHASDNAKVCVTLYGEGKCMVTTQEEYAVVKIRHK